MKSILAGAATELRQVKNALLACWRPNPRLSIGLLCLALLVGTVTPFAANATRSLLNALTRPGQAAQAYWAVAMIAACAALNSVTPLLQRWLQAALTRAVTLHTNEQLYTAVGMLQGLEPFENPKFRDQLRLAQQASSSAPPQMLTAVVSSTQSVATLVSFMILLVGLNPVIAAGIVASAIPIMVSSLLDAGKQARYLITSSPKHRRSMFFAFLLVDFHAVKEIRLYQLNDFFKRRMSQELMAVHEGERKLENTVLRRQAALLAISVCTGGAFLIWSVSQAVAGKISIGDISLVLAGITGIQVALVGLIGRFSIARQAAILFNSFHVLCTQTDKLTTGDSGERSKRIGRLMRGIDLQGVWFRYPDSPGWALRDVTLHIASDESIALVGSNGAGKSTLVKLLCRFYEPTRGTILWDGVDIRCHPVESLRAEMGAVFQDFMTYDLTVRENIGIGDLSCAGELSAIRAAAAQAGAAEFISGFPAGYDTLLSRSFTQEDKESSTAFLSTGQWQRLALARAFMRGDRSLLILDEPSSGLDPEAEARVHNELMQATQGRASVLISHRLAAVRSAHTVYVLAEGRICEAGSHDSLMQARGRYWQLFTEQASGYQLS